MEDQHRSEEKRKVREENRLNIKGKAPFEARGWWFWFACGLSDASGVVSEEGNGIALVALDYSQ